MSAGKEKLEKNPRPRIQSLPEQGKTRNLRLITSPSKSVNTPTNTPTPNIATFDLKWDDGGRKSVSVPPEKKRKRIIEKEAQAEEENSLHHQPSTDEKMMVKLLKLIEELSVKTRLLKIKVTENFNTKRSIKDLSWELSSIVSQMDTMQMKEVIKRIPNESKKVQEEKDFVTRVNACTQTEKPGWKKILTLKEEDIKNINTYEEFSNMEKHTWPEGVFKNTQIVEGNPLNTSSTWDTIIWLKKDDPKMEKGLSKMFRERYPELEELEGQINYITVQTIIRNGQGEKTVKEKLVYRAMEEKEKGLLETLTEIKILMTEAGRKQIAIPKPDGTDVNNFRKMVQTVFCKTSITANVHVPPGTKPGLTLDPKKELKNNYLDPAIIIKTNGAAYADKLKELKEKVQQEDLSNQVKTIRKTKAGDILMTLKKKERVDELQKSLNNRGLVCKNTATGATCTLLVTEVDPTISKEEVAAHLGKMSDENANIDILYTKENKRTGNYMLAAKMQKTKAKRILDCKILKIGLAECKVKEKIEVKKCFKCWEYGHDARDCKGKDRYNCCFKCGKTGHKAKECKEEEACVICQEKGHQTGTFKCKAYRQAFNQQKKRKHLEDKIL